jgi:hypothetical protein
VSPLLAQIVSGIFWVFYGSFFEWYWHKYWMHQPRTPKEAFRGHTIVHHGLYKGNDTYFVKEGEHPEHILLKPYALPAIVLAHLPLLYLIDKYLFHHTMIGGVISMIAYFVVYEYMHWNMHVPRGHFVERFKWFQFLRNHHHLHHRYFMKNFCVLFPLADLVFGTLETEESLARRKAAREQAIANGERLDRKPRTRLNPAAQQVASQIGAEAPPARLSRRETLREEKRARRIADWKSRTEQFQEKKQRRHG